jgi:hypothetical protein
MLTDYKDKGGSLVDVNVLTLIALFNILIGPICKYYFYVNLLEEVPWLLGMGT